MLSQRACECKRGAWWISLQLTLDQVLCSSWCLLLAMDPCVAVQDTFGWDPRDDTKPYGWSRTFIGVGGTMEWIWDSLCIQIGIFLGDFLVSAALFEVYLVVDVSSRCPWLQFISKTFLSMAIMDWERVLKLGSYRWEQSLVTNPPLCIFSSFHDFSWLSTSSRPLYKGDLILYISYLLKVVCVGLSLSLSLAFSLTLSLLRTHSHMFMVGLYTPMRPILLKVCLEKGAYCL